MNEVCLSGCASCGDPETGPFIHLKELHLYFCDVCWEEFLEDVISVDQILDDM